MEVRKRAGQSIAEQNLTRPQSDRKAKNSENKQHNQRKIIEHLRKLPENQLKIIEHQWKITGNQQKIIKNQ